RVSAGGVVDAATLDSEQVEVSVKAGGNAAVRATELAEARVSFGGTVKVYGQPKKLIKKTAVGGNIALVKPTEQTPTNE
ncbi:MAG: GIN domain-containing protein, partial [Flavobacteriaceae bacterium]